MKFQRAKSIIHQHSVLSEQIRSAREEKANMERKLQAEIELPRKFGEQIEDVEDEIRHNEKRIEELRAEIQQLQVRRGQLKHRREQAEAHAQEARSIIGRIDKEIQRLEQKITPYARELDAAHAKVKEIAAKQIAEDELAKNIEQSVRPEYEKELQAGKRVPEKMKPENYAKKLAKTINRGRK